MNPVSRIEFLGKTEQTAKPYYSNNYYIVRHILTFAREIPFLSEEKVKNIGIITICI